MRRATATAAPTKLLDYLKLADGHLAARGVESSRLDAELLLAHALGIGRVELYTSYDRPLTAIEVDRFRELLRRRAARELAAYIVGTREFWSLALEVDRRVLIPRPETECLVEAALRAIRAMAPARNGGGLRVLDLGTGSGAIAVALASEIAELTIVATDVSEAALEVAPKNASSHGVADRIEFRQGDLFGALRDDERFDAVVSNPPYCKSAEVAAMEPELREWEPAGALVSGRDGMDASARIIDGAAGFLVPDGQLLLEVGTQAELVGQRLASAGWRDVHSEKDLAGRMRVVAARRPGA